MRIKSNFIGNIFLFNIIYNKIKPTRIDCAFCAID